jgi:glycosyltransferase involved in cell wall biosynthesis
VPHKDLLIVTPDLFDRGGGIARIARATVLACYRYCQKFGGKIYVYALHDTGRSPDESYLPDASGYRGFAGEKAALARAVIARGWMPSHAGTIFCHVNIASLGLLLPPGAGGHRYAVVAHGIDVWDPLPLHRREALRRASEIWPVSSYTGDVVAQLHGVPPERIRVIPNCLDPFWPVDQKRVAPPAHPFILTLTRVSRADSYKGVDTLIAAFARAATALPGWELRILGDGDDLPRLQRVAANSGAGERVRFLGWQPDAEVQRLHRESAFFALPSCKEGFGLVYLEAMAAGRAVLAARATAVPEVALDGFTGRLVPYGDVEATASAIREMAQSPDATRRMGEEGRKRLLSRFTFSRYSEALERVLSVLWRRDVDWPTWNRAQRETSLG